MTLKASRESRVRASPPEIAERPRFTAKLRGLLGGVVTCTGEAWDFELRLTVGGDGSVTGKARGRLVSTPQCPVIGKWPDLSEKARNAAHDVSGKFDGQRFELQFTQTFIDGKTYGLINYSLGLGPDFSPPSPTIVVQVTSATTAQGEAVTNVPIYKTTASGRHSFNLKCETCAPGVASNRGHQRPELRYLGTASGRLAFQLPLRRSHGEEDYSDEKVEWNNVAPLFINGSRRWSTIELR